MSNPNQLKKLYEIQSDLKDSGYVLPVPDAAPDQSLQYPRDMGRMKTKEDIQRLKDLREVVFHETLPENAQNVKSTDDFHSTIFGRKIYDPTIPEKIAEVAKDNVAASFQTYVAQQFDKADPIQHNYLKETYPEYFEQESLQLQKNYEAYIYHQLKMIFPNRTKEDFAYDFLLSRGFQPPRADFWKMQQPTEQQPLASKYGPEGHTGLPQFDLKKTFNMYPNDRPLDAYTASKHLTEMFFTDGIMDNEGRFGKRDAQGNFVDIQKKAVQY